MKKVLPFFALYFLFISFGLFAQPANDDPCNATPLSIGATCTFSTYTTAAATATTGVPGPGCANYQGGDVWFTITVPASGAVTVDTKQGVITDGGMAFYTGANCNALSLLECDDDNSNNGLMPLVNRGGLTPGSTLYVRFWEYGNNGNGTFQLCATAGPNPTNQDCPNAIPICQTTYSTQVAYSGSGSIGNEINTGNSCLLAGERNDVWYTFTVQNSGNLNFLINPVTNSDDYDFAVYNLTNANCADIYNTPALMVSCNFSATPGNTGPNGGSASNNQNAGGTKFNATIPVTAGQTYVVNVSNYTSSNDGYSIDFGASTANILDATSPSITSVNQPIACGATSLTFNFSENILCSSVQNGDFTLTGPGGPYTVTNWTSTGCGTGAAYDNSYTVTVSPPVTATGNYSLCLTNTSGSVTDLCGNVAAPACLVFPVSGLTVNPGSTNPTCNGATNGTAGVVANGGSGSYTYVWSPNVGSNANVTGLSAGSYTVTVSDLLGCSVTSTIQLNEPAAMQLTINETVTTCGGSTGSITVANVNGGTAPYQYSDNNGVSFQLGNAFNGLAAGNYTVVVKDDNGCTSSTVAVIASSTSPTINATPVVDLNCNGISTGSITINASGGSGALQYSIDNGTSFQAGNVFNGLAAGAYSIIVKDASGCQTAEVININEPAAIVVNPNSNTSTCGNSNGNINIVANGGTGTLQYSIDNGVSFSASDAFNNLAAGNYNIVVRDANGCTAASSIAVNNQPGPQINSAPVTHLNCNGGFDGSITVNANGGTGILQYSDDNGVVFQPTGSFINHAAGNYTVVVRDANGCTATQNVVINEPPLIVVNPSAVTATCGNANGSVNIIANGGTGILQYSIDSGATYQGSAAFNGLAAGTYNIFVRDANGCRVPSSIVVDDAPAPTIAATPFTDVTCNAGSDGTIDVTANGGTGTLQYSIDNGANFQNQNNFPNLTAGTYDIVVEDANGCQVTSQVVINEPTPIVVNPNTVTSTCGNANGSIDIIANGGTGTFQYSIDGGITFQNGTNFSNISSGNYNIVVQDANMCTSSAAANVPDAAGPSISATPVTDVSCNGGSDGTLVINANGGTGTVEYSIDNGVTFQNGNNFNGLTAGTYQIVIRDANGCTSSSTADITEPTILVLNANPTTATCEAGNGAIDVVANGGSGTIQYSIDNGATFQNGNNFPNLSSGNYDIVISDANGCSASLNVNVPNAASPTITGIPVTDVLCNGGSNGSFDVNTNGGTGALEYSIDGGITFQSGLTFSNLTAGNYAVVIQDANGCTATQNAIVQEPTVIVPLVNSLTASCGQTDGSITVNANGGTGAYQFSIDGGVTFQSSSNFSNLLNGNYNIVVQDANLCTATDAINVADAAGPSIALVSVTDVSCNSGANGTLIVNANGGTGAITYSIDGGTTFQNGNNFNGLTAGNYQVVISDVNGCTSSQAAVINEPTALHLNANPTTATCEGSNGSVEVIANGGTGVIQYSIDNGTTFQIGNIFSSLASSNYDVVIQDANGCTATLNVNVPNAPSPVIAAVPVTDVTCNGGSDGSLIINTNGGTGTLQYSINDGFTYQPLSVFNNLTAGNYNVVIQDANGCTATQNAVVQEPTLIVPVINTVTASCGQSDGSVSLNANGGAGGYQYSIDGGVTFQNGGNFPGLPPGNYDVVVKDASGCTVGDIAAISNASAPAIVASPVTEVTCNAGTDGTIIINANGGTGALQYSIDNGVTFQPTNNFSNLPAGNYNAVVKDVNGCIAASAIAISEPAAIVLNSNTTPSTCGSDNGTIIVAANGGTGTLQYSSDNGVTYQPASNFTNLPPGNYDLAVSDANGCVVNGAAIVIDEPSPLITSVNTVNVICNNGTDGSIDIHSTGGTGLVQYSIDGGVTLHSSHVFSNLSAGNYDVFIQDANGCSATQNANIAEPSAVGFNYLSSDASCGHSDGSLIINANGGAGPYQYSIDNGLTFQNANSFNNLNAGNYDVVVKDNSNCSFGSVAVVNNAAAPSILNAPATGVSCNGGNDGTIIVNGVGGTGALQFSIDNGITFFLTNNFNSLPAGNYDVLVQDANGCQAALPVVIVEPLAIILNPASVTATCGNANGSIDIDANGGTGILQYSIDAGVTYQAGDVFNNLSTGNYDVAVRDANGCVANSAIAVANAASPVISGINSTDLTCNNANDGTIVVNANGGTGTLQYSIDGGTTYQSSNSFNNLGGGNFDIVVQDANLCEVISAAVLAEPPAIVINPNTVESTCGASNGEIILNANGGNGSFTFSIDNGATFQSGNTFNGLLAGNYDVVVKDGNNCSITMIVPLNNASAPAINATNVADASCYGNSNGSITVNANGGIGALQYSIDGGVTYQATGNFPNLIAGNYNIVVVDANGCSVTSAEIVNQPGEITYNYNTVASTCGNTDGSATLTAQGGSGVLQYSLDNGTTFQAGNVFNNLGAGNYDAVIRDASGCTVAGIVSVSNLNGPIISNIAATGLTCFGSNDGTLLITAAGGTGSLSFSADNGTTFQTNNSFSNLPGGAYAIVVLDGNNCVASTNVLINEPSQVVFNSIINSSTCENSNGSIQIIANGGTGAFQYSNNNGTSFQNGINFNNLLAGNYTLVVTDANGCTAASVEVVNNEASPTISAANVTDVDCNGNSNGTLTVISNGGTGSIEYSIDNGVTFFSNNNFTNLDAGNYNIVIHDANGCTAQAAAVITQPLPLNFNSTAITSTCSNANGSVSIVTQGGTGAIQYSIDNGTTFQTGNVFNSVSSGSYDIVIKDANGCLTNGNINVPDAPAPLISGVLPTDVLCNGGGNGSLVINANGGSGVLQYSIDNGLTYQPAHSFNNLTAGIYHIQIIDTNGCVATQVQNIAEPASIIAVTNSNTASCNQNDGSVLVVANGGTGALQYSINGGVSYQAANSFQNLYSGNYSIIVKDANGCTAAAAASVNNANGPLVNATPSVNVSCNGGSNGSININANGGTGILQYSIDNGVSFIGTNAFNNLMAGSYEIVVQDVNGCNASATVEITQPDPVLFNTNTSIATCGNNNGAIEITGNGGTGTLQYSIDSGATFHNSILFNNLASGNYDVVVQDANGCQSAGIAVVGSGPSPVISATQSSNVTCFGYTNGVIDITANGGSGQLQYSIDGGTTYQLSAIFDSLSAGNYTIVVLDTNGCTAVTPMQIIQPDGIVLNTSAVDVNCFAGNDGIATVNVTGGSQPFSYIWSSGAVDSVATNLAAGNYTVTVTDANLCTSQLNAVVNEPAVLSVQAASANVACYGGSNGSASVNVSGGTAPYTYLWSNSIVQHNINGLTAGNYSVLITDGNGCAVVELFSITQPIAITASSSVSAVNCFGGSNGTMAVSPQGGIAPYIYQWSSVSGSDSIAYNLSTGSYTVTITDANGCTLSVTDDVVSPSLLSVNTNPTDVSCNGQNNGSVTAVAAGGVAPYTYLWSNSATTASISNLSGGVYKLTVTDFNTCLTQKTSVVAEPQPLVPLALGATTICISQSANISASATGGTSPYYYTWSNGTINDAQLVTPTVTTTYYVDVTDANGCTSAQQAVTITVNPPLAIVASDDTEICEGQSTGISSIASGGNGGPYNYLWSNNATTANATVSPVLTTNYVVNVTDNCGTPFATDNVTVIVNPLPQVAFQPLPASGCMPLEVNFSNTTITPAGSVYNWSLGDNAVDSIPQPVHIYTEAGSYDVKLTVTTPEGCISSQFIPEAVNVFALPVAAFTADPPRISILHPEINFINNTQGGDYWSWDFGDGYGTSNYENPKYVYKDSGTYNIMLIAQTTKGCVDTTYGEVIIDGDFTIYIPNAFTPNDDGHNDFFNVYGIGIRDINLFIFNRWGEQVFKTDNLSKGWDGRMGKNNKPSPEDVYVYLVKLIDFEGKKREFSGSVSLIR